MSGRVERPGLAPTLGDHERRVTRLERRPPPVNDIAWASIKSTDPETIGANTSMTFALDPADSTFLTNDSSVFQRFAGTFDGIQCLQPGVYYAHHSVEAALASGSPAADTIFLQIAPGSLGADTEYHEIDNAHTLINGITRPSDGARRWYLSQIGLLGIPTVLTGGAKGTTIGAQNLSATAITASGGNGAYGKIFLMRLSDPLSDFSDFSL